MLNALRSFFSNSLVVALLVLAALGGLLALFGGAADVNAARVAGLSAGGLVVKVGASIVAVALLLLGLTAWAYIRSTPVHKAPAEGNADSRNIAAAIRYGAAAIALAIVLAATLGGAARGATPEPHAGADDALLLGTLPERFLPCAPYQAAIDNAVSAYWGVWQYPDAWMAQLYQESLCDPSAISHVGASGLAQFMPATWAETAARLGLDPSLTPFDDVAIDAGAFYMAGRMGVWAGRPRPGIERWRLGLASYNAGAGHIIAAQSRCGGARDWRDISPCLPLITGHNAAETQTYVRRIERWWRELSAADPFAAPAELRP